MRIGIVRYDGTNFLQGRQDYIRGFFSYPSFSISM